jgi:hypothetical protein
MKNTPGNPNNYPANVRTIEDGDKRNATNLAAQTEDLADRTAYIHKKALEHVYYSLAALAAVTDAELIDRAYVLSRGWYHYDTVTSTPDGEFIVAATGMGSGSWISEYVLSFLVGGDGDPFKVQDALLPYHETIYIGGASGATLAASVHSTSWGNIAGISHRVGVAVKALDRIDALVGPFEVFCASGDIVNLRVVVTQNGVLTWYPLSVKNLDAGENAVPVSFPILYSSNGTQPIDITLQAANLGSATSHVNSPVGLAADDPVSGGWGTIGAGSAQYEFINYKVLRKS